MEDTLEVLCGSLWPNRQGLQVGAAVIFGLPLDDGYPDYGEAKPT
jgi:hypothetical protein